MLSKQERVAFEKAFRSLHLTKDLRLRVDEDEVILALNLPYTDLEGIDTFSFYGEDIESPESFSQALQKLADDYDPIDELVIIFRMRMSAVNEERAKDCLRCDLDFVDTVDRYLGQLALLSKKVVTELETTH